MVHRHRKRNPYSMPGRKVSIRAFGRDGLKVISPEVKGRDYGQNNGISGEPKVWPERRVR